MKRVYNLHEQYFSQFRVTFKNNRRWLNRTGGSSRFVTPSATPTQPNRNLVASASILQYLDIINGPPDIAMTENQKFEVTLDEATLQKVDAWIASRPESKPSRIEAISRLIEIALIHSNEVEYLQAHVAQADKDIREQFDRVLGMIDHVVQGALQLRSNPRKLN